MKNGKTTVADIARQAGVSPATVSRALNHPELLKPATLLQVESAMNALGLTPEFTTLAPARQQIIVLNIPEINNSFYQEIIRGANTSAQTHGYSLMISVIPIDRGTIQNFCSLLNRINAAGVILLTWLHEKLLAQINAIAPLIQCCEYNENAGYSYVAIDDVAAAESAVEYLITCGHNKIAFINGPNSFAYARKRKEGFLNTILKNDLFIPGNWIISLPEISYEMAYSSACRLLSSDPCPNAFFVISDTFAAATVKAAQKYKLRIPRDIMVVGFDNVPLARMTTPSLTTVNQPAFQQGYSACELLFETLNTTEHTVKTLVLGTELIVRESTASKV